MYCKENKTKLKGFKKIIPGDHYYCMSTQVNFLAVSWKTLPVFGVFFLKL